MYTFPPSSSVPHADMNVTVQGNTIGCAKEARQLKLAFILFDTLALLKVPQLELVVQSASKDEAAVGGEHHKGHRRVGFVYEGFQALPAVAVPYSAQAIIAAGNYQCAISVEVYSCDRVGVSWQHLHIRCIYIVNMMIIYHHKIIW